MTQRAAPLHRYKIAAATSCTSGRRPSGVCCITVASTSGFENIAVVISVSTNVGAPDLSDIGAQGKTEDYFTQYVADPSDFGNTTMPKFENLGDENLRKVAAFLVASKKK